MCELLKDWLKDFDQDIERQHRKVLLLLDNCSAQSFDHAEGSSFRAFVAKCNFCSTATGQGHHLVSQVPFWKHLVVQLVFDINPHMKSH